VDEAPRPAFPAPLTALAAGPLPLSSREQYLCGTVARGVLYLHRSSSRLNPPNPNDVHNSSTMTVSMFF
jgi:hypothetical protein